MRPTRAMRSLLMLAPLVLPSVARAQRYWHDEQGRNALRIDFGKPFLKGEGDSWLTGAILPSMSIRAGEGIRVEADVPFMRAGYDFGGTVGDKSSFRVGNPYIGLRIGDDTKMWSGTLGFRVPLNAKPDTPIASRTVSVGTLTTFDEYEAYESNTMTVRTNMEARWVSANHVLLGAKAGPSVLITTDGNPQAQTDIFFDYGGRLGYESEGSQFTVALTGRYLVTPADRKFERCQDSGCSVQRFHHAATGTVELRYGTLRPRLSLRIPFNKDIRDITGGILTVGLSVAR